jgi:hypothetical protein
MPDFEVTSPDGKTFIVSAPEGATQDQALAYAKEQHAAAPAPASGPPVGRLRSVAQGLGDMAYGGAQLMAHTFGGFEQNPIVRGVGRALGMETNTPAQIDEKVTARESDYQAKRKAAGEDGIDGYRMLGNAAASLPLAAVLPVGATLGGAVAAGAVGGAVTGALEPVTGGDYWQGKKNQLLASTAGGAALGPAGLVAGRMIAPRVAPAVRTLDDAGVKLTPGQIVGGTAQRLEDAAQSIPVVGDAIKGARRQGLESFNRSAANEALEPIGATVGAATPAGREMAQETGDQISGAYQRAYSQAQPFGPDAQFAQDIQQLGQQFLTPASRNIFAKVLQNDVISRIQAGGGQIDAEAFQAIKQELGNRARQFSASQEPHNRELADAFGGVLEAMHGLMARSNPQTAPLLRQADAAFARNVRVEGAAGRVGSPDGVFTPAQLSGAVRAADGSVRHNAYARGNALMQDLSDAGKSVLPSTVPDSGTGLRTTMNALALGGAAYLDPTTATIGAGIMAAYTSPAQRFMQRALLAPRAAGVTAAGEAVAGSGGVLGGVVANEWGRPLPNRLLQD